MDQTEYRIKQIIHAYTGEFIGVDLDKWKPRSIDIAFLIKAHGIKKGLYTEEEYNYLDQKIKELEEKTDS